MSFLNPVNEPVKRFKSTDAGAPQINYNVRTAGDVKAVLKACLVTGYGAVASAGWSVVNEVNHAAEFVSPSAAMSAYRLGIDDSTTASTTWYYRYLDARINPKSNSPSKTINAIDRTHASNGWQLLVTDRGLCFIEVFYNTHANKIMARIAYLSGCKLAVPSTGVNMVFINAGQTGASSYPSSSFNQNQYINIAIGSLTGLYFSGAFIAGEVNNTDNTLDVADVDIAMPLYVSAPGRVFVAQQAGFLVMQVASSGDVGGVTDDLIDGRPYLRITLGSDYANAGNILQRAVVVMLALDYWEY